MKKGAVEMSLKSNFEARHQRSAESGVPGEPTVQEKFHRDSWSIYSHLECKNIPEFLLMLQQSSHLPACGRGGVQVL